MLGGVLRTPPREEISQKSPCRIGLSHCTQADSATNNILSIWLDNNRQLSLPRTCCQMSHPGGFEPQTLLTKVQRLIQLATVTGKS